MRRSQAAVLALLLGSCAETSRPPPSTPGSAAATSATSGAVGYERAIQDIAADIERLKGEFPQLREFSARSHCDPQRLVIAYGYRTGAPRGGGGWSSAVPSPDEEGVWFHLDFHDPGSTAQVHTQPMVAPRYYGEKKVLLLILEGARTRPLAAALNKILAARGVTATPRRPD